MKSKGYRLPTFYSRFIMLGFLFLIFSTAIYSQSRNSNDGIQTNIIETSPTSTKVEFILNEYDQKPIDINGTVCTYFSIEGSIWLMEKGFPQLPSLRSSIIIPDLAGMNFNIITAEYTTIETLPVMPSKGHFTRDIDPNSVP